MSVPLCLCVSVNEMCGMHGCAVSSKLKQCASLYYTTSIQRYVFETTSASSRVTCTPSSRLFAFGGPLHSPVSNRRPSQRLVFNVGPKELSPHPIRRQNQCIVHTVLRFAACFSPLTWLDVIFHPFLLRDSIPTMIDPILLSPFGRVH